jgi:hypothetical protein
VPGEQIDGAPLAIHRITTPQFERSTQTIRGAPRHARRASRGLRP